jgi:hypothetical protein
MRYHVVVSLSVGVAVVQHSKVAESGNLGQACARSCQFQRLNPTVEFYVEDSRYCGNDPHKRVIFSAKENL